MLTLLGLKCRFEDCVKFLSFSCNLFLQRSGQNFIVFVRYQFDLLFVTFLYLFDFFTLFFLQIDHYFLMVILLLTRSLFFFFQCFLQLLDFLSFFTRDVLVFVVQNIGQHRLFTRQFGSHTATLTFVIILKEHRPIWVRAVSREIRIFAFV